MHVCRKATAKDWNDLIAAILASCSLTAAQGFLGYTPDQLNENAVRSRNRLALSESICLMSIFHIHKACISTEL